MIVEIKDMCLLWFINKPREYYELTCSVGLRQ